jgi:hypothetical protein
MMSRPLIQIDNDGNSREMTKEEHEYYLELWSGLQDPSKTVNETPAADA